MPAAAKAATLAAATKAVAVAAAAAVSPVKVVVARGGRAAEPGSSPAKDPTGSPASFRATYEDPEGVEEEGGDDPGGFFVFETGAGSWS